jgi:hypothetical protein
MLILKWTGFFCILALAGACAMLEPVALFIGIDALGGPNLGVVGNIAGFGTLSGPALIAGVLIFASLWYAKIVKL